MGVNAVMSWNCGSDMRAYSTCFGALEPVLKDFSVNTQASAGARNLLVLHLDSTVKGQAGRLTELRNGNGRCQNHLD